MIFTDSTRLNCISNCITNSFFFGQFCSKFRQIYLYVLLFPNCLIRYLNTVEELVIISGFLIITRQL